MDPAPGQACHKNERILSNYRGGYFADLDVVRLKRKAKALRDQIILKVPASNDPYEFYTRTLPILDAAIRGELKTPLLEKDSHVISGNYRHDGMEGTLAPEYDADFDTAVSEFVVTLSSQALEAPAIAENRDGGRSVGSMWKRNTMVPRSASCPESQCQRRKYSPHAAYRQVSYAIPMLLSGDDGGARSGELTALGDYDT